MQSPPEPQTQPERVAPPASPEGAAATGLGLALMGRWLGAILLVGLFGWAAVMLVPRGELAPTNEYAGSVVDHTWSREGDDAILTLHLALNRTTSDVVAPTATRPLRVELAGFDPVLAGMQSMLLVGDVVSGQEAGRFTVTVTGEFPDDEAWGAIDLEGVISRLEPEPWWRRMVPPRLDARVRQVGIITPWSGEIPGREPAGPPASINTVSPDGVIEMLK